MSGDPTAGYSPYGREAYRRMVAGYSGSSGSFYGASSNGFGHYSGNSAGLMASMGSSSNTAPHSMMLNNRDMVKPPYPTSRSSPGHQYGAREKDHPQRDLPVHHRPVPLLPENKQGWQNSIRHNCPSTSASSKCRATTKSRQGLVLDLDPDSASMFENGSFLRREIKLEESKNKSRIKKEKDEVAVRQEDEHSRSSTPSSPRVPRCIPPCRSGGRLWGRAFGDLVARLRRGCYPELDIQTSGSRVVYPVSSWYQSQLGAAASTNNNSAGYDAYYNHNQSSGVGNGGGGVGGAGMVPNNTMQSYYQSLQTASQLYGAQQWSTRDAPSPPSPSASPSRA
ncbi:hypothetical protein BV898_06188 [Hypsibius exemplaris]|uniref:Fork-head domain-containing protein n=1 Tax=Hypsibius exemplaris TaxID=2072580 RepID=A0A1W0WXH9_HYPEX|nr:hypothetical protein BV898_06188 [Hypsibius exemplaris]